MPTWFFLIAGIAALIGLALKFLEESGGGAERLPYTRRHRLLTSAEIGFLNTLEQLYGSQYRVLSQVHLASLMEVARGTRGWQAHFNRIDRKSVDFVLCTKEGLEPVLAIELDDRTHEQGRRIERDKFVDAAFEASGIPLIHIKLSEANTDLVRERVDDVLKRLT